ncbi:MAG: hypothetical protein QHH26_11260 [Armatimonadota bacterium]|nr:hypothetical protein [Armatimonadota bacterium]
MGSDSISDISIHNQDGDQSPASTQRIAPQELPTPARPAMADHLYRVGQFAFPPPEEPFLLSVLSSGHLLSGNRSMLTFDIYSGELPDTHSALKATISHLPRTWSLGNNIRPRSTRGCLARNDITPVYRP